MGNESSSFEEPERDETRGNRALDVSPSSPATPSSRRKVLADATDAIQRTDKLTVKSKSIGHRKELEKHLRKCYIFETMVEDEMSAILDAFSQRGVIAGHASPLVVQGDAGEAFYVVQEGIFRYLKDGIELGEYHTGDFWGKMALMHNAARTTRTVVAVDNPASVWVIDRPTFRRTLALVHQQRRDRLVYWFKCAPVLSKLKAHEMMDLVNSVRTVHCAPGERLLKKGEATKSLQIVTAGKFQEMPIGNEFEAGCCFGEMALLGAHTVENDVAAVEPSTLLELDVAAFEEVLAPFNKLLEAHYNTAVLHEVPSLKRLTLAELKRLNDVLIEERHQSGSVLVDEGSKLNKLVFIVSGSAVMTGKDVAGKDKRDPYLQIEVPWEANRRDLGHGDHFGQTALLTEETCKYKVVVTSEEPLDVMTLSRKDLTAVLGPLHRLILQREHEQKEAIPTGGQGRHGSSSEKDSSGNGAHGGHQKREDDRSDQSQVRQGWTVRHLPDVKFKELRTIAEICSEGDFSTSRMVLHKPLGNVYLLKAFSKQALEAAGVDSLAMREKTAQAMIGHPFVQKLYNTYHNSRKYYLLSEFVPAGELYYRIHPPKGLASTPLDEDEARFYAASAVLALGYMHSRSVLYRSLRPENVWIDAKGFIRLVNLESAKYVPQGELTHTLIGVPDYISPEVIMGQGHYVGVDWWALGVFIFEMLTGHAPFEDETDEEDKIFKNILRGEVTQPVGISAEAWDLISRLLHSEAPGRFGCQCAGSLDVQGHRWFKGTDFVQLSVCEVKPPFIPVLRSRGDFSHFPHATKTTRGD